MPKVNFKLTADEYRAVFAITKRAVALAARNGRAVDELTLQMDVIACHANGCPLDLARLAAADDFNFVHDVFGINRHIDRKTGRLRDCFLPRFAVPDMTVSVKG